MTTIDQLQKKVALLEEEKKKFINQQQQQQQKQSNLNNAFHPNSAQNLFSDINSNIFRQNQPNRSQYQSDPFNINNNYFTQQRNNPDRQKKPENFNNKRGGSTQQNCQNQ